MEIPIVNFYLKSTMALSTSAALTCFNSTFLILIMIKVMKANDAAVGDDDPRLNASLLSCLLYFCSKASPPSFKTGK